MYKGCNSEQNRIKKNLCPCGAYISLGETANKIDKIHNMSKGRKCYGKKRSKEVTSEDLRR